ncbi:MAG TPA: class I SAM-dependent methyltransferase [Oligoflexia bacterium]|nr:class I SAM-dependent methyltransferase [Oligoflexia bacterium]HMP27531.1 class I SAM-dependent methyltransferase [Oligoflexia bacterium]
MPLETTEIKKLQEILANETDMYFLRRTPILLAHLSPKPEQLLLEIGCGRGYFINMINKIFNCKAIGIELDSDIAQLAMENLKSNTPLLARANALNLPFNNNTFDRILMTEVLEHIEDDKQALSELIRVSKPGAKVAISVPNQNYPFLWDPLNWLLEGLFKKPIRTGFLAGIWANHCRLYTADKLRELLLLAGLKIESITPCTHYCFPFAHNLVYGIGKELLIRGYLPKQIVVAADRMSSEQNSKSLLNPINIINKIFRAIDRLNDYFPKYNSSVGLIALASLPDKAS